MGEAQPIFYCCILSWYGENLHEDSVQALLYLLGLLAMIKCSICSYQCDNWHVSNRKLACHVNFCWGCWFVSLLASTSRVALAWHFAKRGAPFSLYVSPRSSFSLSVAEELGS